MNGFSKIINNDLVEIYDSNVEWEKLQGKTVLITGAYGMLASYLVLMLIYLNEEKSMGINIVAIVRSECKMRKRFGEYVDRDYMHIYTEALNNPIRISEEISYIIHAASFASPDYYGTCPVDVIEPNVIGTYNLLNFAKEKNIRGFLLFSSGDIYGSCNGVEQISENISGSLDTLNIHNCYSESKRLAETMCKAFNLQYNVPIKIARIWHTYSPTMDIERDPRVFVSFVKDVVNKRDIVMKSSGEAKRSFCYITDAVSAYFKILLSEGDLEAYNICNTREWHSIYELAKLMVGIKPELGLKVVRKARESDENYVENTEASFVPPSNEKLRVKLGWEPRVDCVEGFGRVLEHFKEYMN